MQKIYRRALVAKHDFNKLHFGMGVLLYIKFTACIFPKHIFLRNLWVAVSDTDYLAHFLFAYKIESSCMSWKLNERQKMFIKIFMTLLKSGARGRNKTSCYILL